MGGYHRSSLEPIPKGPRSATAAAVWLWRNSAGVEIKTAFSATTTIEGYFANLSNVIANIGDDLTFGDDLPVASCHLAVSGSPACGVLGDHLLSAVAVADDNLLLEHATTAAATKITAERLLELTRSKEVLTTVKQVHQRGSVARTVVL